MKFDDLFGTDDLMPVSEDEKSKVNAASESPKSINIEAVEIESDPVSGKIIAEDTELSGEVSVENCPVPESSDNEKRFFGMRITGRGGNRKYLIASVILILISGFFVSMATIWVKMKKNRLSYELAGQVRLMKKLSRKKALYKLEYSYLKSRAEVKSAIEKDGWVEIHPKNIIHVKTASGKKQ